MLRFASCVEMRKMKQVRRCGLISILSVWMLAPFADAVPPPPPTRGDLVNRSDVIAIVTVTKVSGRKVRNGKSEVEQLSALANVERVFKGVANDKVVLTYDEWDMSLGCRPPSLYEGKFLVFLKKQGTFFTRTDAWYGQHSITTNHVQWQMQRPQELSAAIREIEEIARNAKK